MKAILSFSVFIVNAIDFGNFFEINQILQVGIQRAVLIMDFFFECLKIVFASFSERCCKALKKKQALKTGCYAVKGQHGLWC